MRGKKKSAKVKGFLIGSEDSAGAFFLGVGSISFLVSFIGRALTVRRELRDDFFVSSFFQK